MDLTTVKKNRYQSSTGRDTVSIRCPEIWQTHQMALLVKAIDLQGVPTTSFLRNLFWTILTPGRSIGLMSKVIQGQCSRQPPHFREIFIWTILTPWRSICLMSKVIQGQCHILGHPINVSRPSYSAIYSHTGCSFGWLFVKNSDVQFWPILEILSSRDSDNKLQGDSLCLNHINFYTVPIKYMLIFFCWSFQVCTSVLYITHHNQHAYWWVPTQNHEIFCPNFCSS